MSFNLGWVYPRVIFAKNINHISMPDNFDDLYFVLKISDS